MSTGCLICDARSVRAHHLTGRDADGRYLDPDLKLPCCHDHHELAHDDWRILNLQDPSEKEHSDAGLSFVERVERRLRRAASFMARLAEAYPQHAWIARTAQALKRWADELARDIAARDRRDAGWRSDPAFYPTEG